MRVRFLDPSCLAAVLSLAFLSSSAPAQPQAPPPPRNFFTDNAGVVPGDVATRIEGTLREFEKTTSNQVLVVVADRIPEGYTSVEEYTNRTAEAWRVGDKGRDNGAVLFVFVGDRKMRIEVGYGLEGALPDALASRIINDEITPSFRQGRYGEGLVAGVDAIIRATKGEYQPIERKPTRSSGRTVLLFVLLMLFLSVGLPILGQIDAIQNSRTYSGRGSMRGRRSGHWGSSGGGFFGGGGGSWGGGGGFSGGGGGFSGGGGSFGGGGASGSW
jgi:uncharacterized protein